MGALALLLRKRSAKADTARRSLWLCAAGGAMLVCGPLVFLFARGSTEGLMLALALTPVVVGVAVRENDAALAGRLWPGLAGVAGLLLVLSQPSLSSPATDALLMLAPLLTGCGAALLEREIENADRSMLPAALFGAAAVLASAALLHHAAPTGALFGLASGLDGLEALLTLLALTRLGSMRWSAQFALVPLLVLLEGLALLRTRPAPRAVVGLLLLAVASFALLTPAAEEPQPSVVANPTRDAP
jgi:drug/metabolite transporter (DMT)-like permease